MLLSSLRRGLRLLPPPWPAAGPQPSAPPLPSVARRLLSSSSAPTSSAAAPPPPLLAFEELEVDGADDDACAPGCAPGPGAAASADPALQRTCRAALLGAPNAGKSTLVNALVGSLVAAASRKTNTTRRAASSGGAPLGCLTSGDAQVLLADAPGVVDPGCVRGARHGARVASAWQAAAGADTDVLLFLVDAARAAHRPDRRVDRLLAGAAGELARARASGGALRRGGGGEPADSFAASIVRAKRKPLHYLVLTKADLLPAHDRLEVLRALAADLVPLLGEAEADDEDGAETLPSSLSSYSRGGGGAPPAPLGPPAAVFAVSALRARGGLAPLRAALLCAAVPGAPWPLPAGAATDLGGSAVALQATHAALFDRLHAELPYRVAVTAAGWEEFRDGSVRVAQTLTVPTHGARRIVVGARGAAIGQVGIAARRALERAWRRRVHLVLDVRVAGPTQPARGPADARPDADAVAGALRGGGGGGGGGGGAARAGGGARAARGGQRAG